MNLIFLSSTLLQLLVESSAGSNSGRISSSSDVVISNGELIRLSGFRIAYYNQSLEDSLDYEQSALQHMINTYPTGFSEQAIRAHLGAFGLSGDMVLRQVGTLSGGQKCRIILAQLTMNKPNLLLLDEPTNNLDLDAVAALGEALKHYQGAVLLVSHDLTFVAETCGDSLYHISKGELIRLEGGIVQYQSIVQAAVARQRKLIVVP